MSLSAASVFLCVMKPNMKKTIFLLLFAVATHLAMAQRTVYHHQPEKLFNQGKEMFLEGNYTGAQDLLSQYVAESNDRFPAAPLPLMCQEYHVFSLNSTNFL